MGSHADGEPSRSAIPSWRYPVARSIRASPGSKPCCGSYARRRMCRRAPRTSSGSVARRRMAVWSTCTRPVAGGGSRTRAKVAQSHGSHPSSFSARRSGSGSSTRISSGRPARCRAHVAPRARRTRAEEIVQIVPAGHDDVVGQRLVVDRTDQVRRLDHAVSAVLVRSELLAALAALGGVHDQSCAPARSLLQRNEKKGAKRFRGRLSTSIRVRR